MMENQTVWSGARNGERWSAMAPSNIALVKYWGKRDPETQWPANDSLSMTLNVARSITTAQKIDGPYDVFQFSGQTFTSQTSPQHKVFKQLSRLKSLLGFDDNLLIETQNTFPAGCGIASSASGFAALTLAALAAYVGQDSWDHLSILGFDRNRLANLARLGSGSAARSLFGGYVRWSAGSSHDQQIIQPVFSADHWPLTDLIVVLSDEEKSVPSSTAHLAAWASPLFAPRLSHLNKRLSNVTQAIANKDMERLGEEIEAEALEMHAVAMTGEPRVNYFLPKTVEFLTWMRGERARGKLPAWFTIDAGPNVHVICEQKDAQSVQKYIQDFWPSAKVIADGVGNGPRLTKGNAVHD